MKTKSLIKFDETELEILSSEKELSEINGGKNLLTELLEGIGVNVNENCGCNNGCSNG